METGSLFHLATTMVSVLHKELEYKVEKPKYRKLEVMQPRIKNKSEPPAGESWISPKEVLQLRLIISVYHLLVKNKKVEGRGGLLTFFP